MNSDIPGKLCGYVWMVQVWVETKLVVSCCFKASVLLRTRHLVVSNILCLGMG